MTTSSSEPPIQLEETTLPPGQTAGKIKLPGTLGIGAHKEKSYTRATNKPGTGAVRVKTFYGRLNAEGLSFLDDKVNDWLEQHPEAEVKFITTSIGVMEAKVRETVMIMNVWY